MNLTIPRDFLVEIGRVSILQSHIEAGLAIMITNLAGVDRAVGDAITKPLSFKNLAEVTTSLLKLREADIGEYCLAVAAMIARARKAEERRNQLVHSLWSFGPDFDPMLATRLKLSGSPPTLKPHTVAIDEIRALVTEMGEICDYLVYIHPKLRVGGAMIRNT